MKRENLSKYSGFFSLSLSLFPLFFRGKNEIGRIPRLSPSPLISQQEKKREKEREVIPILMKIRALERLRIGPKNEEERGVYSDEKIITEIDQEEKRGRERE